MQYSMDIFIQQLAYSQVSEYSISVYCIVISSVHWLLFHSSCSSVEVCQCYGNHHEACCTVQYSGQALCHQLAQLVQTVVVVVGGLSSCLSQLCTS